MATGGRIGQARTSSAAGRTRRKYASGWRRSTRNHARRERDASVFRVLEPAPDIRCDPRFIMAEMVVYPQGGREVEGPGPGRPPCAGRNDVRLTAACRETLHRS